VSQRLTPGIPSFVTGSGGTGPATRRTPPRGRGTIPRTREPLLNIYPDRPGTSPEAVL